VGVGQSEGVGRLRRWGQEQPQGRGENSRLGDGFADAWFAVDTGAKEVYIHGSIADASIVQLPPG
jgi:hypothetical protein